jgi:hypothetical protein
MTAALRPPQRHLVRHPGGNRVIAQELLAAEAASALGRPSAEHVLNVLA